MRPPLSVPANSYDIWHNLRGHEELIGLMWRTSRPSPGGEGSGQVDLPNGALAELLDIRVAQQFSPRPITRRPAPGCG